VHEQCPQSSCPSRAGGAEAQGRRLEHAVNVNGAQISARRGLDVVQIKFAEILLETPGHAALNLSILLSLIPA